MTVITSATTGLLATASDHLDLFRLHRASWWQTLLKLRLPGSIPFILSGVRISSGIAVVGAIVGSGIVRHSHKWIAEGGTFAILGLLMVWVAYFVVGLAMCDNVSMMPEKGGTYAWARKTMGRFAGSQVGWLYLVGFTCLSVILSWLAYKYSLLAMIYYFPSKTALLGAMIFSIIIPMFFILYLHHVINSRTLFTFTMR